MNDKLNERRLPKKSRMSLPSVARPVGFLKKVMPLGPCCGGNTAQNPPVSELESPKLKIASNLHLECAVAVRVSRIRRRMLRNGDEHCGKRKVMMWL